MRSAREGALALAQELRDQGGTVAEALLDVGVVANDASALPGPAQLAAAGPRTAGRGREYELLIEMIHEGTLLHYGAPRVLRDDDPDLALLLGDQLYAMGLQRLAQLGDLEAVAELADLISLLAQVQVESAGADSIGSFADATLPAVDRGGTDQLVAAIWQAGAAAIGWGPSTGHEAAKALARAGDDRALGALLRVAVQSAPADSAGS